jgi:hypothetical protein
MIQYAVSGWYGMPFRLCQDFKAAVYAGYTFHVEDKTSAASRDNSIFRLDYKKAGVRGNALNKSFARVQRIFTHIMYPGGPTRVFVQGAWYRDEGVRPIAGTQLVSPHPDHIFTLESKFVLLTSCYQQPVALWPHDPKGLLPDGHLGADMFDVIDRNEEQEYAE